MKSSLPMMKCLLDKILSRDELIPVKETRMKFYPSMKKGVSLNSGMKFYSGYVFT